LCERFAINRTSLNELFRKQTGQPIIQYLIALRIRFACVLLRDTTLPIKEVVARTGFSDVINFNRTFKKRTARTPVAYRREFNVMVSC
jgi:AraC family L-rhamnose operon regulatory protein RhaS